MPSKSHHFSSWKSTSNALYELTDEDVKRLHTVLLDMYKEIRAVCEKYSLHLIAAGGTALGAIRHRGFIPWDDDMDLFMFRSEFRRFAKIFEEELGENYYLLDPGSKRGANCFLPRIVKKHTTFLGMIDEASPYPKGIYIDINLIEYAPEDSLNFKIKALGADARRFVSYSVYWYQYPSRSLKDFMLGGKGASYYKLRMLLGRICSFRSAEDWFRSFDRYVQGRKSKVITVPSGAKTYKGERLDLKIALPLKKVPFEDTEIYVFHDSDGYLTNLYGDYMTIPKAENREHHLCVKLNFDEEE